MPEGPAVAGRGTRCHGRLSSMDGERSAATFAGRRHCRAIRSGGSTVTRTVTFHSIAPRINCLRENGCLRVVQIVRADPARPSRGGARSARRLDWAGDQDTVTGGITGSLGGANRADCLVSVQEMPSRRRGCSGHVWVRRLLMTRVRLGHRNGNFMTAEYRLWIIILASGEGRCLAHSGAPPRRIERRSDVACVVPRASDRSSLIHPEPMHDDNARRQEGSRP
jgi:hypothetical protein